MSEKCKHFYADYQYYPWFVLKGKRGFYQRSFKSKPMSGIKDDHFNMRGFKFTFCPRCGEKLDECKSGKKDIYWV